MTNIGANQKPPTRTSVHQNFAAVPPADELALAIEFAKAEKSENSRRAYRSDFDLFTRWCAARDLCALPASPETLATFLASEARRGSKPSSIARRVAGIRHAHRLAGYESPSTSEMPKATLRGIRRVVGTAPVKKSALTAELVRAAPESAPDTMIGLRDRALLLLGFAAALRRSELVALDVADLEHVDEGLRLHIRGSKTDTDRAGAVIPVPHGKRLCPVKTLTDWLAAANITDGPIFRSIRKGGHVSSRRLSDRAVADIVKRTVETIGGDPVEFSGHSLRSGFLTSASSRGASLAKMMAVSRHKSPETLLGYIREANDFAEHAADGLL